MAAKENYLVYEFVKRLTTAARGDPYMSTLRQAHIIPITMILRFNSLMANVVAANTTPKHPISIAAASFAVLTCIIIIAIEQLTNKIMLFLLRGVWFNEVLTFFCFIYGIEWFMPYMIIISTTCIRNAVIHRVN